VPRVSVVIPVRDQGAYLGASLASVFAQSYRDLEVIVVDDGSREDLAPALAPYRARIRVERQAPAGAAAAYNRGAALATGEVLAFHDADDLMEPARVALPLAHLDSDPRLAVVFGNGTRVGDDGRVLGPLIPPRQARDLARHGVRVPLLLRRSIVYLQASVIRRRVFEEIGGLPTAFAPGGDWAFFLRCALHHPMAFVDAPLFRYRQHATSQTAARIATARDAVAVLRDLADREPALAAQVGGRRVDRAIARRLARLAAQELRAGDRGAARAHLEEAAALAPWIVKYRVRAWKLGLRRP
jgi:glycosyltransferase involved in cell wall biosynthesis